MQTWPHFTRFCAKTWNTRVSPVQRVEVPCLSNVTRMTVHLNSLLGDLLGWEPRGQGAWTGWEMCMPVPWGRKGRGKLSALLAQTIGRKKAVRGMCFSVR